MSNSASNNSSVDNFHSAVGSTPPSPVPTIRESYCVWEDPDAIGVPHISNPHHPYPTIEQLRAQALSIRGLEYPDDSLGDLWLPNAILVMNCSMIHREQDVRSLPRWGQRLLRSDIEVDMIHPRHVFAASRVLHLESFRRQERMHERVMQSEERIARLERLLTQ